MVVLSWPATGGAAPLDSLLRVLDEAIASHREYAGRREKQIELLGRQLRAPGLSDERRYQLTNRLYELYEPYICDSAIACLNRNIELADAMGAPRLRAESRIRLSFLLASTGMYMEASDVLHEVERSGLDSAQAVSYFSAYVRVYDELYGNTQDLRLKRRYRMLAEAMEANLGYRIPCPALLICGEKDRAGSCVRYNRAWHQKAGIPLAWIPHAGHNANSDAPEAVNSLLERFIGELPKPGAFTSAPGSPCR